MIDFNELASRVWPILNAGVSPWEHPDLYRDPAAKKRECIKLTKLIHAIFEVSR